MAAPTREDHARRLVALSLALLAALLLWFSAPARLVPTPKPANSTASQNLAPQVNQPAARGALADRDARAPAGVVSRTKNEPVVVSDLGRLPLSFEANRGQTADEVKFLARGRGYTLFLTATEAALALRAPVPAAGSPMQPAPAVLRMRLAGANPSAEASGVEELPGRSNYFIGNDPAKWVTDVPHFARVLYREVYPGIDLAYYGRERELEYDLVVAPGADPARIRLAFAGAERVELTSDGNLRLHLGAGEVIQHAPVIYQADGSERESVVGRYVLKGEREVGFEIAAYDRTRPLIIDPVVLSYSTFLAGNGDDRGFGIAVDSSGNVYLTGWAHSTDFPRVGAFQNTLGGIADAFVTKINATGTAIVYSTYLGGSRTEYGYGITVDSGGNAYVTGETNSTNFPVLSPLQATLGGGLNDAFIAKLNPTGNALVYSTYLGGSASDSPSGIAIDTSRNVYVTGSTSSTNFPTASPLRAALAGASDIFVAKINPAGSALVYSTYLGGSGNDRANAIAVDGAGSAVVAGNSASLNIPLVNPVQSFFGGRSDIFGDAYVAKLNAAGSALVYATYLGGAGDDRALGLALDSAGNAYITGDTFSCDFPTTSSSFQPSCDPFGGTDAFVAKLSATGALVYSSYLAGTGFDRGFGIAVDASGSAYVTGYTEGFNFPAAGAYQSTQVAFDEVFVSKINPSGSSIAYSTYLGGALLDQGSAIALDSAGNAYITGRTNSSGFPVVNPIQGTLRGSNAAFVTKVTTTMPDNFAGATLVNTLLPFSDTVETSSATTETVDPTPSCGNGSRAKSLWYRFTAPTRDTITAQTLGSAYDTILSVWTGPPGAFHEVACNDDASGGAQSSVSFVASAGVTYSFMVSAKNGDGGRTQFALNFQPAPPANDSFAGAETISSTPFTHLVNTRSATLESTDPTFVDPRRSVWYRFRATNNGTVIADTLGSDYNTTLCVWTGSPGNFTRVTCGYHPYGGAQSLAQFSATAATTYYFMVGAFGGGGGKLVFHLDTISVPPNDEPAGATNVTSVPFSQTLNTLLATESLPEPRPSCGAGRREKSVWFRFTPSTSVTLYADTLGSGYDTVLSVWTGPLDNLTQVACSDDFSAQTRASKLSIDVTAGTTYYFWVSAYDFTGGTLVFNLDTAARTVPANDAIANATDITSTPFSQTVNTVAAQIGSNEPRHPCANGSLSNNVWYRFTPSANTPVTADTIGSSYDTILSVWTGAPGALSLVSCNDDAVGLQSRVSFPAIAGTTYYFMVSGLNPDGGSLVFNLTLAEAATQPPPNETFASAATVSSTPFAGSIDTRTATTDSSDPTPGCGNGSRAKSVWYRFTAPAVGMVIADTFGSSFNTLLSVWTGSPGAFTAVACNDDTSGSQSQVSFIAAAGVTYYFMASAVNNDGGTLVFNLAFLQGVTSPIPTANFLTFVPHSAFGGGFLTRLYITNLSNATNAVTVNRISQTGAIVSSTTATLAASATIRIEGTESQRTQSLTIEWFAIGSQQPVSASVLFDCCATGSQVTSAVGVLGQAAGTSFTAPFVYQREGLTSQPVLAVGMAIANRADQANNITVRLLDSSGVVLTVDTPASIPAFGQTAFTVSQLPNIRAVLSGRDSFLGSLVVVGTQSFAPVYVGNLGGRLFSLPIVPTDQAAGAVATAIPHFVTGGGFLTRLWVRNLASGTNNLTLETRNQNGSVAGTETLALAQGQTIERSSGESNRAGPQTTQWIALSADAAISASVLFDCCAAGTTVASAVGVLNQAAGNSFIAPFVFQRESATQPLLVQGLGLANRANTINSITIRLLDETGAQVSSDTVGPLSTSNQTAFTVSELPNLSTFLAGKNSFLGSLLITSSQPLAPVIVGNLGGRLFSLPLASQ